MSHRRGRAWVLATMGLGVVFASGARGAPPPRPADASAPPPAPASAGSSEPAGSRRAAGVARALVTLLRGAKVLGTGFSLAGDGRIVTSRSLLGVAGAAAVVARRADGTTVKVRLAHADPLTDLALLLPEGPLTTWGLAAAPASPESGTAVAITRPGAPLTLREATVTAGMMHALDRKPASGALLLEALSTAELGAPLLDKRGDVLGLVVHGCAPPPAAPPAPPPGAPCPVALYATSVGALRVFLASVPVPSLGLGGAAAEVSGVRGVLITRIDPKGPAAAAGLRVRRRGSDEGDLLVGVGGIPTPHPGGLEVALQRHLAGDRVELLFLREGRYRAASGVLAAPPPRTTVLGPASAPAAASASAAVGPAASAGPAGAPSGAPPAASASGSAPLPVPPLPPPALRRPPRPAPPPVR